MSVQALTGKFMELFAQARACCAWGCTTDIERRHHMKRVAFLPVAVARVSGCARAEVPPAPSTADAGTTFGAVWRARAAPHGRNNTW
jgi:hypothetical protein